MRPGLHKIFLKSNLCRYLLGGVQCTQDRHRSFLLKLLKMTLLMIIIQKYSKCFLSYAVEIEISSVSNAFSVSFIEENSNYT